MKKIIIIAFILPFILGFKDDGKMRIVGTWAFTAGSASAPTVSSKVATATWNIGSIGSYPGGRKIIIIGLVTDNISTTDGNTNNHISLVTDEHGNWSKLYEFTNGQGSAAGGVTVSIWWALVTGGTATNIIATYSGSITAMTAQTIQVNVGTGKIIGLVGSVQTAADDGADASNLTVSGLPNTEHLFLRLTGVENNAYSFVLANYFARSGFSTGSGAASNVGGEMAGRILTTASESTNPTTSTVDGASIMLAVDEIDPPSAKPRRVTIISKK